MKCQVNRKVKMETLFYLTCFFSFIKIVVAWGGADTQPYCILISAFSLLIYGYRRKIRFPKKLGYCYLILLLGVLTATIITIVTGTFSLATSARYLATYPGLVLISLQGYVYCKQNVGFREETIKKVINTYLIVGLIQKFVYRQFAYMFVSNTRTTENRGVISLTAEPSFYGYMCVFLLILVLEFNTKKYFYAANLLFQIFFLAESSITVLYLIILSGLAGIYALRKCKPKHLLIMLITVFVAYAVLNYFREHSSGRLSYLLNMLFSGGGIKMMLMRFETDASIMTRFDSIGKCVSGFFSNIGFPHGFDTPKFDSGYGSLIYTLGWFGAIVIGYIFLIARNAYEKGYKRFVIPIFITIIMFSAIQIANPVFAFLIGYWSWKEKERRQ